jgi:hypothetical protein
MPDYDVTSPDGRKFRFTGDHAPTTDDILAFEKTLGPASKPTTPPAKPSGPSFLGASTKPASLKPPEGTVPYLKRQAKALGRTMYEAIPMITGAVGGGLTGTAAAPTGPVGSGLAAMGGAGAGGLVGKRIQQYIRALTSIPGPSGSEKGSLPRQPLPPSGQAIADMGAEATAQMEMEANGRIVAAPLGFVRRGGFLNTSRETMQTLAEDTKRGTRLSGPEMSGSTRVGAYGQRAQGYGSGSIGGQQIQREARAEGTTAAQRELDQALKIVGKPTSTQAAGRSVVTGMNAAKSGLGELGKDMEKAIENAPSVSMTTPITVPSQIPNGAPVAVPAIKDEAMQWLQSRIVPLIRNFPEESGAPESTVKLIRELRSNPGMIQKLNRPQMLELTDAILSKYKSPVLTQLRSILGAEDVVDFRGLFEKRRALFAASGSPDDLFSKKDVQAVSKQFAGLFTKHMAAASPEFATASGAYRRAAFIENSAMQGLFKTAVNNPEQVVDYLKSGSPTRANDFKRALLVVAQKGPDAARARAVYDVVRSTLWQERIVQGGSAPPHSAEEAGKQLEGMAQRIRDEEQGGAIKTLFADKRGQELMRNAKAVAGLLEKRVKEGGGQLRMIFEISRGVTAIAAFMKGGTAGGLGTAAAWEAIPDFYTWLIHDPKATRWFIQGVNAKDPNVSSATAIRVIDLWQRVHQKQPAKPATAGAPP